MKTKVFLFLTLTGLVFGPGCTDKTNASNKYTAEAKTEYSEFKKSFESKLAKIDKKISKLEKGIKGKSALTAKAGSGKLKDLQRMRMQIGVEIDQLNRASKESFGELKASIEGQYDKLAGKLEEYFE